MARARSQHSWQLITVSQQTITQFTYTNDRRTQASLYTQRTVWIGYYSSIWLVEGHMQHYNFRTHYVLHYVVRSALHVQGANLWAVDLHTFGFMPLHLKFLW